MSAGLETLNRNREDACGAILLKEAHQRRIVIALAVIGALGVAAALGVGIYYGFKAHIAAIGAEEFERRVTGILFAASLLAFPIICSLDQERLEGRPRASDD